MARAFLFACSLLQLSVAKLPAPTALVSPQPSVVSSLGLSDFSVSALDMPFRAMRRSDRSAVLPNNVLQPRAGGAAPGMQLGPLPSTPSSFTELCHSMSGRNRQRNLHHSQLFLSMSVT